LLRLMDRRIALSRGGIKIVWATGYPHRDGFFPPRKYESPTGVTPGGRGYAQHRPRSAAALCAASTFIWRERKSTLDGATDANTWTEPASPGGSGPSSGCTAVSDVRSRPKERRGYLARAVEESHLCYREEGWPTEDEYQSLQKPFGSIDERQWL